MSRILEIVLAEYITKYQPREWLFEGQYNEESLHVRTAQTVFKDQAKLLGLTKSMSYHTLRHAHATHLLENGTDISIILKILGHQNIKTTTLYLHVAQKDIAKIESPL